MAGPSRKDHGLLPKIEKPRAFSACLAPLSKMPKYHGSLPNVSIVPEGSQAAEATSYRNSSQSKFLRLPLEVRLEIYKALLGERLVHVRLAMGDVKLRPWRHVVCHIHSAKDLKQRYVRTARSDWESAHSLCEWQTFYDPNMKEGSSYFDDERMQVRILRCCRQIYVEANLVLWSTNTFSIHDHQTLKQFMMERNATQKSYMRSLRLRFDLRQRLLHFRRSFLTPELMHSLSGLHTLHLILEDEFPARLAHLMAMTGKSLADFGGNRIDAGLEPLSLLPLRTVSVEVYTPTFLESEEHPLTERWRTEYAESVQKFLLGQRT